ncbi:unnamed protein product [Urochloa humidicola]
MIQRAAPVPLPAAMASMRRSARSHGRSGHGGIDRGVSLWLQNGSRWYLFPSCNGDPLAATTAWMRP